METVKYSHESRWTPTPEKLGTTALARPSSGSKLQTHPLVREGAP
jgi:hypothetical protein